MCNQNAEFLNEYDNKTKTKQTKKVILVRSNSNLSLFLYVVAIKW